MKKADSKKVECILHIGTEKTGTSSIQWYLNYNREINKESGVLYLDLPKSNSGSQIEFVGSVKSVKELFDIGNTLSIHNENQQEKFRSDLISILDQQITSLKQEKGSLKLIISCEHFHSRLMDVESISKLKELLQPFVDEFKVIMYVRRQTEMAASYYSTKIKSGFYNIQPLPNIVEVDFSVSYYFDFWAIYKNWTSVFGVESMIVKIYQIEKLYCKDIVKDFCHEFNIPLCEKTREFRINESLTIKGLVLLENFNKHLKILNSFSPNLTRQFRENAVQILSLENKGKPLIFTRNAAIEFQSQFTDSNNAVFSALKSEDKDLFSEGFEQYPEVLQYDVVEAKEAYWLILKSVRLFAHKKRKRLKLKLENFLKKSDSMYGFLRGIKRKIFNRK